MGDPKYQVGKENTQVGEIIVTDEQIIEAAKQLGFERMRIDHDYYVCFSKEIVEFAKLVAKHERLMCSKFLQETMNPLKPEYIDQIEEGIWND